MSYEFSEFGQNLGCGSGIGELMEDLGNALANGGPDLKMLGGGQPAQIPEMNAVWRRRLDELLEEPGGMRRALTAYDPPGGNPAFLEAIATLFREEFGWEISSENVASLVAGRRPFTSFSICWPVRCRMARAEKSCCLWCRNTSVMPIKE